MRRTRDTLLSALAIILLTASLAHAQEPAAEPGAEAQPAAAEQAAKEDAKAMRIAVRAIHGATEEPIAGRPVFLRAARPRGPFEPTAPEPAFEWSAFTDDAGIARFDEVPRDLATRGLRLHAVTTHAGVAYESAATAPAPGVTLTLKVYEKSLDASGVAFEKVRTIVEPWEEYLVFTQYYTLTNTGQTAVDTAALPGVDYEKGLPLELPAKAQGVQIVGQGDSEVVKSHAYWRGVLQPGDRVQLQIRFSMSARGDEFVYEQELDYPVRELEVVVPLQTKFEKLPRLDGVALLAPGFEAVESGAGLLDLREDMEFLVARGQSIEADQSFRFKLTGLPFDRPVTPWVFLGLGVVCGGAVLVAAGRERRRMASSQGREAVLAHLRDEREELFEELVALEVDFEEGLVGEVEYDAEVLSLRERIALVLKKIADLEESGQDVG